MCAAEWPLCGNYRRKTMWNVAVFPCRRRYHHRHHPQGDADFRRHHLPNHQQFQESRHREGQKYQPGEVVKTLVTDSEGKASTADDLLPHGEYILHESATNESMLLTAPDQVVLVEDDGVIYEFTMADEVVRGGVLIEKRDLSPAC